MEYPVPGVYRHFKGNYYKLLYTATDSETMCPVAVYKALYGDGGVWVRPFEMFCETVERDGNTFPRFEYVCRDESELKLLNADRSVPVGDDVKLWFFGTGSGTQPRAGRHHVSFAVETEKSVYWFDAGECGSYMAHIMGLDLMKVRSVFISHCHMDHVGGLGNLLWNIRKLTGGKEKRLPVAGNIDVYIPVKSTYDGLMQLLSNTEGNFECEYTHTYHPVSDGVIYSSPIEDFSVTAVHNHHLAHKEGDEWKTFSYIIRVNGKTVVFSGDLAHEDIARVIPEDGCDIFMCETGHNKPLDICNTIKENSLNVKRLFMFHNGPRVMDDIEGTEKILEENFSGEWRICEDATTYLF